MYVVTKAISVAFLLYIDIGMALSVRTVFRVELKRTITYRMVFDGEQKIRGAQSGCCKARSTQDDDKLIHNVLFEIKLLAT